MEWDNENFKEQQKIMSSTGFGCFFLVVVFGILITWYPAKFIYHLFVPEEHQLLISHSPNEINTIKVIKKDDFPDPTIIIKYDDKSIMKTTIPETVSVEWNNDFEAQVILTKQENHSIVEVKFE